MLTKKDLNEGRKSTTYLRLFREMKMISSVDLISRHKNDLDPDERGVIYAEGGIIAFEGFNRNRIEELRSQKKGPGSLEEKFLDQWEKEFNSILSYGWLYKLVTSPVNVFWAIVEE